MRETEIGSAPFRLRTFTVVACLSAGSAICRVRAIEMPLRVIVASGRRTATALTRQVKALDAVTIYPAPDHQCGQRPKHPRCWKTPPPWVMRCSIEWRRVMLQPSYRCHDHSSRRLVELHPVDRHRPRRRDPLRRDRAHRRRHILRSRANDIGRSAGADPARRLAARSGPTHGRSARLRNARRAPHGFHVPSAGAGRTPPRKSLPAPGATGITRTPPNPCSAEIRREAQ